MAETPPHTVFVIGAGASLAEALDRRPKKRREHPPLDATFFRRVARYRSSPLFRAVQSQASRLGEPNLARADPPLGLEDYLGRLYFNVQQNPLKASVQAYWDAVDLYAREIITTTNWMIGKAGLMRRVFQKEIKGGNRISVLTFNVDLLIENALERLAHGRPSARWCLSQAYGYAEPLRRAAGSGPFFEDEDSVVDIPLYKLHGSVNWVFRTRSYYPPADLVRKERQVWQILDKQLPLDRITLTSKTGRNWYMFPLIIPPVYEKHGLIRTHLQEVWDNATTALDSADRVVFWGYSFPVADTHARHFFQGLAQQNPALKNPILINPDPSAATALWSVMGPTQVAHYRSANEYLAA